MFMHKRDAEIDAVSGTVCDGWRAETPEQLLGVRAVT